MAYYVILDANHNPSKPIGIVCCDDINVDFFGEINFDRQITFLYINQFKARKYTSKKCDKLLKFLTKKGLL